MKNLIQYLNKYYEIQDKILLLYRPYEDSGWGDRCLFLSDSYIPTKKYNHRAILRDEVVIEFDTDNKEDNRKYADEVAKRMKKDNIAVAKWFSGNKSVHVHAFFDFKKAKNIQLVKKIIMRKYCDGLPLPDLQLAIENHMIRAEYGLHEKTGAHKKLISRSANYPERARVPMDVWKDYTAKQVAVVKRKLTSNLKELENLNGFKHLLSTHEFKENDDGRERALFILIHTLKEQYRENKEELVSYLQSWYKYSGGRKLDDSAIQRKVVYHWNRDYQISRNYLYEFLESIGRTDLIEKGDHNEQ